VAEERIRERGGITVEGDGSLLVAVFDASDPRAGSTLAVEAALAVVADAAGTPAPRLAAAAAISLGRARVGSTRARGSGESRWTYGAQGPAVERASEVVRRAAEAGVVLAADAAAVVADRFELERAHSGTYRVLARVAGDARRAPERSIRTILVTDIVGSTRTIEHVGDRLWNELVAAHDEAIRSEVVAFGGEEIDTAGDGFLASFDSPTRAIGCALALPDRVASLGLEIRVGIHAGEVEHSFEKPRGTAVHLASRIAATAGAGEILVSATTRELAAGAAFVFDDRGEYVLKGLSEPKRLYAVVDRDADGVGPAPSRHSPADCGSDRPAGLTEREVDVLRLVAFGLSDAEAAERLFLSVRTVNAHLRSVYRKLGVRSRAAAGRFALINGLLEPERPA
jgi:class 3 adenylate cyclase/DNA-binding CsgD family transcriptional regulator